MQSTNRSGIQCIQHPNQQITNFCLNNLKPLCPECVQIQTRQSQKPQIQSWKNCINKSSRNIKTTLDHLRSMYDKQNQYQSFKSIDMIQNQNVKKLQSIKDKIIRVVQDVFQMHQQKLRMTIRSQYKNDPPDTSKLKMAIQQLQKVLMKLGHHNTVIAALKKSLLLDHGSLISYFQDFKSQTRKAPITENFVQQNQDIGRIKHLLDNYIMINTNGNDIRIQDRYHSPGQFKSSYDPLSSGKKSRQDKLVINISQQNYFQRNCRNKYLHFFIPVSRQLKLLNIESALKGGSWRSIQFKSKNQLPCFFKSIITPSGQIFLTGGSQQQKRYRQIYRYNYEKNSLDFVCKMINDRSSHSICYVNNCIYLIGGFTKKDGQVSRQCQVFKLDTQSCQSIASLNAPSANSSATAFNNSHIFKFGGVLNKNQGNSLIQMYSIKSNKWIIVNIQNSRNTPKIQLLSFSAGVQTSDHQILVFGGYDNSQVQRPQRVCYTVQVNPSRGVVLIKNYNICPLPYAQGFWNNNPIINDRSVYALQNITDQQDQLTAIADDRRLLVFNGDRWI